MREYKFRGKDLRTKEWCYGGLDASYNDYCIIDKFGKKISIINDTVGQYIGLNDANDKEIYEGDILCIKHRDNIGEPFYEEVIYEDYKYYPFSKTFGYSKEPLLTFYNVEVVGNIYERKICFYDEAKNIDSIIESNFNDGDIWRCSSNGNKY